MAVHAHRRKGHAAFVSPHRCAAYNAHAHARLSNAQAEGYAAFLSSTDGQAWQTSAGISSPLFSRDKMPPPPCDGADYGADW